METLHTHWQTVLPIVLLAAWIGKMLGPKVWTAVRSGAVAIWPRLRPHLNAKTLALPTIAAISFALPYLPRPTTPDPAPSPRVPDLYDNAAATARQLLADELEQIAGQRFDSPEQKEDAMNQKIVDIVQSSFEPLFVRLATAADTNLVAAIAQQIREGELRD